MHMKQIPSVVRRTDVGVVMWTREKAEDAIPHPWDVAIASSDAGLKELKSDLAFKVILQYLCKDSHWWKILDMLRQVSHGGCDSCFIQEAWK